MPRKPLEIAAAGQAGDLWLTGDEPAQITLEAAGDKGEKSLRRVKGVAYSGGVMYPEGYGGMAVVVDLAGVVAGSGSRPLLLEHEARDIVGHTEEISLDNRITVVGLASGVGSAAVEVIQAHDNGFPWKLSIGGRVGRPTVRVPEGESVQANGRTFKGPLLLVRKFDLREISFVAVAGDDRTSVRIAASANSKSAQQGVIDMDFEQWLQANGFDPAILTDQQRSTLQATYDASKTPQDDPADDGSKPIEAGDDAQPDPVGDYRARMAAETERVSGIMTACGGEFGQLQARAIKEGWDVERTKHEVKRERELRELRAGRPRGPAIHGEDGSERSAETLEAALCLSAGMPQDWLGQQYDERTMNAAVSRRMRDTTIHVLMDHVICAAGHHYSGSRKSNDFIRAALRAERSVTLQAAGGFSSLSLAGILSNVANKAMMQAYEAVETVHQYFCAMRSHSDFKVNTRYRLDSSGAFRKVGPDGELKHVGLSDAAYTNQVDTFGAIIALTRQMIINDDLGAFLQIPTILGRMSAIRVEEEVFKLLLSNPGSFFAAGNRNYFEGADSALSLTSLGTAEQKFVDQVDINAKPILVTPSILLVGSTLKTMADNLWNETQVQVTTTADKPRFANNPHKGKYRPYVSPYLNNTAIKDSEGNAIAGQSDTQWYLFADPNNRAAIAVATLNGRRVPTIESDESDFNVLGMQWRGYHDFGVGMEETIAAVKSKGAA